MTLPLLISMAVMGLSVVSPPRKGKGSSSSSSSTSLSGVKLPVKSWFPCLGEGNGMLATGVAMGILLSWAMRSELQRTRINDKIRLCLLTWFRPALSSGEDEQGHGELGKVLALLPATGENVRTIVSPSVAMTSSLWVSTITIPPRHELKQQRSNRFEFFYVLEGQGEYSCKKGKCIDIGSTKTTIRRGDAFAVDFRSIRWIGNTSSVDNLTLLRSSDAGHLHSQTGYDDIVATDTTRNTTTVSSKVTAVLSSGYQQMGDYINSLWK